MAEREIIVLNETEPQLEAAQSGDTYLLPRATRIVGALSSTTDLILSATDNVLVNDTVYGIMSVQAGSTEVVDVGTTKILVTAWNTDGLSNGMTVDHTDDSILANDAGTYEVSCHISFAGTGSAEFQLEIYVYDNSGTSWGASGFAIDRKMGSNGDVGACSFGGLVHLDVNDKVSIYMSSGASTDDITITESQLIMKRISD